MDGLSAAASVIAAIQVSSQVFDLCRTYYLEVKDARTDIQRLRDEMTALQDVLTSVADLANAPSSDKLSVLRLISKPYGPLQDCRAELERLLANLEESREWPFSRQDVGKVITAIERYKAMFGIALTVDQTYVEFSLLQWWSRIRFEQSKQPTCEIIFGDVIQSFLEFA